MKKEDIFFDSRDGHSKIHAARWIPEGKVRGIVQIVHGMAEYIERYAQFAEYLANRGYVVTGEDHLGHGRSVASEEEYGYFGTREDATVVLVRDVHRLKKLTQETYPGVPYFILGHSMGSFITRKYLAMYGSGIDGAVIVGTAWHAGRNMVLGRVVSWLSGHLHGWEYKSALIDRLTFGNNNKKIKEPKTNMDWLSRNEENVQAYLADRNCGFLFTANGYYTLFKLVQQAQSKEVLEKTPKNLSIFVIAGAEDPVGHYGKDIKKLYQVYKELGVADISMKLYDGDRHELLNETDREDVYADIYKWIEQRRK